MQLTLVRLTQTAESTPGTLWLPTSGVLLHTLELPWIPAATPGGVHERSCVPLGLYDLVLHNTPKHPRSFALVNPDLGVIHEPDPRYPNARVACLLHIANVPSELLGCIGVGLECGDNCLFQSRSAYVDLQEQLPWEAGHTLEIVAA